MFWIIHALDKEGMGDVRLAHVDRHREFLNAYPIKTIISGPLMDDAGQTMIGSFFLVEADTREEVEKFHQSDPFHALGIWQPARIHAFYKRVDLRQ
jgi:hypothetical protein